MVLRTWLSNVSWHANAEETFDAAAPWNVEQSSFSLTFQIGEGAFGVIYKCCLRGETVAAKKLKDHVLVQGRCSETASGEKAWCAVKGYEDLVTELAVLVSLGKHPNVVEFRGACLEDTSNPIIFEEFTLFAHKSCKPEPWVPPRSVTYSWTMDMVNGLVFLHNRVPSIIHRDMKPGNLLLTKDLKRMKITDFGMCKMVRKQGGGNVGAGNAGTEAFMAPEVFHQDRTRYTDKVDIYSAAVVMWYTASGMGRMLNYRGQDASWRPDLSWVEWDEFGEIIAESWAACPEQRPSATELLSRLQRMKEIPGPIRQGDFGRGHCIVM